MTPTPKRGYAFTCNNYTEDEFERISRACSDFAQYAIIGREVGEQGTPHLQGYIRFKRAYRFSTVKDRHLPRCHVEVARGSPRQNRDYCSKGGNFTEFGELPAEHASSCSRDELATQFATSMEDGGGGVAGFAGRYPGTWYFSGHNLLRNYWSLQEPVERPGISVSWYYGEPGVGKSRRAHGELPGAFVKDPRTKWWNGYMGQKEVIIDDFGPMGIDINHLLRWFDRYKCTVETKGGMMPLLADKFVVTSNFHPQDVYKDKEGVLHPQTAALERRLCIEYME